MVESPASPRAPAPATKRPLSPHLQVYRPQITSGLSIFHRFTGVGLAGGIAVLMAWLVCLAWLPDWYAPFMSLLTSPLGKIFLYGWTWAFFFHFGCGIRHLLWDFGWCFSLRNIYLSGYIVLAASFVLTIGLWVIVLGARGAPWL
jgi:succinate dehydrogenase / fumarate reductase, cytochrome b subunit